MVHHGVISMNYGGMRPILIIKLYVFVKEEVLMDETILLCNQTKM